MKERWRRLIAGTLAVGILSLALTACAPSLAPAPTAPMMPRPTSLPTIMPRTEPDFSPLTPAPTATAAVDNLCTEVKKDEGIVTALIEIDKKNQNGVDKYMRLYTERPIDPMVVISRADGSCFVFSLPEARDGSKSSVSLKNKPFFADNGFITQEKDRICKISGTDAVNLVKSLCSQPVNK